MMELLTLTGKKLRSMRLGVVPCVMLVLMTARTLLAGDAMAVSGLCAAFLPFFAQLRSTTCAEDEVTEEQEIFSTYLLNLFLVTVGMVYLRGLTFLGSTFYAGYEASPILEELCLLTYVCDLAFISITTPLTYALPQGQRTILAVLLANVEIGFMLLANKLLLLADGSFVLSQQWGLYVLIAILPTISLGFVHMQSKRTPHAAKATLES